MKLEVFISHSHKDHRVADAICHNLEGSGLRCWIAPRDINPGEIWSESIANAIPKCQVMVIVFSSFSNASKQVLREIELAISAGVILLPFRIEDIKPTGGMSYYLATTHWIDIMDSTLEEKIDLLQYRIKQIRGENTPVSEKYESPLKQNQIIVNGMDNQIEKSNLWKWIDSHRRSLSIGAITFIAVIIFVLVGFKMSNQGTIDNDNGEVKSETTRGSDGEEQSPEVHEASTEEQSEIEDIKAEDDQEEEIEDINTVVSFQDPAVASLMSSYFEKPAEEVTIKDMMSIKRLLIVGQEVVSDYDTFIYKDEASGLLYMKDTDGNNHLSAGQVTSLDDLRYCKFLEAMIILNNQLDSLETIPDWKFMRDLGLGNNGIKSLDGIEKLEQLQGLSVFYNEIQSIKPLESLVNLNGIELNSNYIQDITVLGELTELVDLNISGNLIQDVSPINKLKQLKLLSVDEYLVADIDIENSIIEEINGNSVIRNVDVADSPKSEPSQENETSKIENDKEESVVDTTEATEVTNSTEDSASSESQESEEVLDEGSIISFADPILELEVREQIGIPSGEIRERDVLPVMKINFDRSEIKDLEGIQHLVNLRELNLKYSSVTDISRLADVEGLEWLNIHGLNPSNIEVLANMKNLRYLNVFANENFDLNIVSNLTNLTGLILAETDITDLSPLINLTNIRELEIQDNNIFDIGPLVNMTNMTHLTMYGTRVRDISVLSKMNDLYLLILPGYVVDDLSPIKGLNNLTEFEYGDESNYNFDWDDMDLIPSD